MKVIIVKKSLKRFLVELDTNKLIREVAALTGKGRNPQAVATVLTKGRIKKEIMDEDLKNIEADIILNENEG